MSLVERAIKKLQEAKHGDSRSDATSATASNGSSATINTLPKVASSRDVADVSQATGYRAVEVPSRIVEIDRTRLRSMNLLPPANFERQIASQYQQIKRPLVDAALGRAEPPIPNGNLIMLTSALPGEGKTFTSINLALSMAREKDIEVVLVDADVAKPHVSEIFGVTGEPGLLDLLVDTNLHANSVILATDVPRLRLLPAGHRLDTPTELLASARMAQVVEQLVESEVPRVVLFDSPPLLLSTESRALVASAGQVVLVVRAEVTSQKAVFDAIEAIGENKPVNLILNQVHSLPSSGYYGYGSYADSASESAE